MHLHDNAQCNTTQLQKKKVQQWTTVIYDSHYIISNLRWIHCLEVDCWCRNIFKRVYGHATLCTRRTLSTDIRTPNYNLTQSASDIWPFGNFQRCDQLPSRIWSNQRWRHSIGQPQNLLYNQTLSESDDPFEIWWFEIVQNVRSVIGQLSIYTYSNAIHSLLYIRNSGTQCTRTKNSVVSPTF